MHFPKRTFDKPIPISPLIALDRERCILCYRCTRFSENVSEDGQLVAVNRGASSVIATFEDEPYRAHFSGNVVELCPVGALTSTTLPLPRAPLGDPERAHGLRALPRRLQRLGDDARREGRPRPLPQPPRGATRAGSATRAASPTTTCARPTGSARRSCASAAAASRRRARRLRSTPPRRGSARPAPRSSSPSPAARPSSRRPRSRASSARGSAATRRSCPIAGTPGWPRSARRSRPSATRRSCLVRRRRPRGRARPDRRPLAPRRAPRGRPRSSPSTRPATCRRRPGRRAQVCAALREGGDVTPELRDDRQGASAGAKRIALIWSEDDPTGGRHVGALASDLHENAKAEVSVYVLPRTPNGRGVAAAWDALGESSEPPAEGEIGALIVSGDEARLRPARRRAGRSRALRPHDGHVPERPDRAGRTSSFPARATSSGRARWSTSRAAPQRLRRAVVPTGPDELEWLSRLGERFGVEIDAWAAPSRGGDGRPGAAATSSPGRSRDPQARDRQAGRPRPRARRYASLFSGAAVERVPQLQFQRPAPEVELAHEDATTRDIAPARRCESRRTGRRRSCAPR